MLYGGVSRALNDDQLNDSAISNGLVYIMLKTWLIIYSYQLIIIR